MDNVFTQSLWGDEGFSAILSMKSYPEIIEIISRDTSPPLWNTFEWAVFNTFGTNEVYIRSLSLAFYLGTVLFAFLIGKFLWNKKTGIWSALLTALNPFFFTYAFEGRMYSIMAMGVAGSMYFFLRLFGDPERVRKRDQIGYVFFTLWALYSHHFAIFSVMMQGLWWFYELGFGKRGRAKKIFKLFLFVGLGYVPWLYPLYSQTRQVAGGFWLGKPTPTDALNLIADYLARGVKKPATELPNLGITFYETSLYISFFALLFRKWWKDIKKTIPLLMWFLGPIALAYIVSQLFQSIFYNRYILYTIPGAMIVLASKRSRFSIVFLSILLLFFAIIDWNYFFNPAKLPFREFSAEVKSQLQPGDYLINWYDNGTHHIWETKYYGLDAPIYVSPDGGDLPYFVGTALMEENDIIRKVPEDANRVGAVTSGDADKVFVPGFSKDDLVIKDGLKLVWLTKTSEEND